MPKCNTSRKCICLYFILPWWNVNPKVSREMVRENPLSKSVLMERTHGLMAGLHQVDWYLPLLPSRRHQPKVCIWKSSGFPQSEHLFFLPQRIWQSVKERYQSFPKWWRLIVHQRPHTLAPIVSYSLPWRRAWQPTPLFLPGEFHEQGSLAGYSPWDCKESDTTERLSLHLTS